MTSVRNARGDFATESKAGYAAAYPRYVAEVRGGVVRSTVTPDGEVAIVTGGGSGHYPWMAGFVGPGLAHGAATGNVFASPSSEQVYTVAKAVQAGGGVLMVYGMYAGDDLNFRLAEQRLVADGIAVERVAVTDDVSSAPAAETQRRRGVAGTLFVHKAAGWAAAQGLALSEVAALARRANDRVRSLGVAFGGCTLPSSDEPLFIVPPNTVAIGMGIHGEQGLRSRDLPSSDRLVDELLDQLLDEAPADVGDRVTAIVSGLGAVGGEELFVVYRRVAEVLARRGLTVVEPEVGELCTSFDMAGYSISIAWLDDELERAWLAPADSAGFRRVAASERTLRDMSALSGIEATPISPADTESRTAARVVVGALTAAADTVDEFADELGRIDAIAGDGDHGIGMQRGSGAAAREAAAVLGAGAGAGSLLTRAGDAWAYDGGGTSGALWGLILRAVGRAIGDTGRPDAAAVAAGVAEANTSVQSIGGARPGDKTLVDTLDPFATELSAAAAEGLSLSAAWHRAAAVAQDAAQATADLVPAAGRAQAHGERAVGVPDPGAVSMAAIVTAIGAVLADTCG